MAHVTIELILFLLTPINIYASVDSLPNVVFIMADDLGWGNVGYHNTDNPEVQTPAIDYLAAHGLQLNRHYVDAECSPTRSAFQSGRLSVHANTNNNDGITDPSMGVHPDMTCIAEKFKAASYHTHMIGKWDAGFASFAQIPISRGYDTSYGYLGKSIEYFSKHGDSQCTDTYTDLWENDAPAKIDVDEIGSTYSEYIFSQKVLSKIDDMADQTDPTFLFYATHLPHYPSQLPDDAQAKGFYVELSDDESQCSTGLDDRRVNDAYTTDTSLFACRSILQAQVAVLDDIVGQITRRLKSNGLWENTLIVFTTDNGGSLELDETAGNNHPLRGGKTSNLEGGIRATALVSGGYLPKRRRGQIEHGLMHISDWYATFSAMLGVEVRDVSAVKKGLPDVDGMNMWPLLAGHTTVSPRYELVMNKNTLIQGDWKLIVGSSTHYAVWTGAKFPNSSTGTQSELSDTKLVCDSKKNWGCLFNVASDAGEHTDMADERGDLVMSMRSRLEELKADFWESTFTGRGSCPDSFDAIADEYVVEDASDDVDACGCYMAVHNYNRFAGPYVDLTPKQIHYIDAQNSERVFAADVEGRVEGGIEGIEAEAAQGVKGGIVMQISSLVVVIVALVLVFGLRARCQRRQSDQTRALFKHVGEARYGTVSVSDSAV